jgi:recombination protein RecT
MTVVTSNSLLLECEPKTIAVGIIRSAQLGLALDPLLGESYLIPRWNNKNKRMEASWQRGYRGVLKLIRRTGELFGVRADVYHANDKFVRAANGDFFHEKPVGDRGVRTGAYVVFYFKDGFVSSLDMTAAEIISIRDRYSEGYKAFVAGKIKDNPWNPENPDAEKWMWIKTVIFQAAHLAPMETEPGQELVKEAIREELPADEAMDALSAELFESDAPIEMERTEERLSRTDQLAGQLGEATPAAESGFGQQSSPAESEERETLVLRIKQACEGLFGQDLAAADKFVTRWTARQWVTVGAFIKDAPIADLKMVLRALNDSANQGAKA